MYRHGTSGTLALAALSLAVSLACGDDNGGLEPPPTAPANSDDSDNSATRDDEETFSEADFAIDVQDKLTEFHNDLLALEEEVTRLDESARSEAEPMLRELGETVTELEERLIELQSTPEGRDRDAVKEDIEDTIELAQIQVDRLQDAVRT